MNEEHLIQGHTTTQFSCNSDKCVKNIEEILPGYNLCSDVTGSNLQQNCVPHYMFAKVLTL